MNILGRVLFKRGLIVVLGLLFCTFALSPVLLLGEDELEYTKDTTDSYTLSIKDVAVTFGTGAKTNASKSDMVEAKKEGYADGTKDGGNDKYRNRKMNPHDSVTPQYDSYNEGYRKGYKDETGSGPGLFESGYR